MKKINDEVIENIIENVDIYSYISMYVDLQPKSGKFFGLCPFHSEKTC